MLYDLTTVTAAMITANDCIVGFKQSVDPCDDTLPTKYKTSQSGLYCLGGVPGIYADVIKRNAKTTMYASTETYLDAIYPQVIADVLNRFFTLKKGVYEIKEVLEHKTAQFGTPYKQDKTTQSGKAFGFQIRPHKSNNIKAQILSLSGFADTDGTITLHLYRSNKKAVVSTKQITLTADNEVWADVTSWVMYYMNKTEGAGVSWYLLAYEYDAVNYVAGVQMPSTMRMYTDFLQMKPEYLNICPVEFPSVALHWNGTGYDLPDLNRIGYVSLWNGLNFRFNVTCDITQVIVDNKLVFAEAIKLGLAMRIFQDAYYSPEFNEHSARQSEQWKNAFLKLEADLYGYNDERAGFVKGELEKIALDLSGIDSLCLPCKKKYREVSFQHIPT